MPAFRTKWGWRIIEAPEREDGHKKCLHIATKDTIIEVCECQLAAVKDMADGFELWVKKGKIPDITTKGKTEKKEEQHNYIG